MGQCYSVFINLLFNSNVILIKYYVNADVGEYVNSLIHWLDEL